MKLSDLKPGMRVARKGTVLSISDMGKVDVEWDSNIHRVATYSGDQLDGFSVCDDEFKPGMIIPPTGIPYLKREILMEIADLLKSTNDHNGYSCHYTLEGILRKRAEEL